MIILIRTDPDGSGLTDTLGWTRKYLAEVPGSTQKNPDGPQRTWVKMEKTKSYLLEQSLRNLQAEGA